MTLDEICDALLRIRIKTDVDEIDDPDLLDLEAIENEYKAEMDQQNNKRRLFKLQLATKNDPAPDKAASQSKKSLFGGFARNKTATNTPPQPNGTPSSAPSSTATNAHVKDKKATKLAASPSTKEPLRHRLSRAFSIKQVPST